MISFDFIVDSCGVQLVHTKKRWSGVEGRGGKTELFANCLLREDPTEETTNPCNLLMISLLTSFGVSLLLCLFPVQARTCGCDRY